VGLASGGQEPIERAAADLVERDQRTSVYACVSSTELELVAVALSATRRYPKPLHYLEITDEDLAAARVRAEASPGETPVPIANALHFEIDLDGGGAERLVRVLAARQASYQRIPEAKLRTLARQLQKEGSVSLAASSWLLA
jgi:hypothetical protein